MHIDNDDTESFIKFIKECENLENVHEILNFSPPPGNVRRKPFDSRKFREGVKLCAEFLKKTYRKDL